MTDPTISEPFIYPEEEDLLGLLEEAGVASEVNDKAVAILRAVLERADDNLFVGMADTNRLDAFRDLLIRVHSRVSFDLTCGGSHVDESGSHIAEQHRKATVYLAGDGRDDLRDALDNLIERRNTTPQNRATPSGSAG